MAVLTNVTKQNIIDFLKLYDLGELKNIEGISQGVTNSNFILYILNGRFILTIFEVLKFEQVPFFLELKLFLNKNNIPCPLPIKQKNNNLHSILCNKPAAILSFLNGNNINNPKDIDCYNVGKELAKIHLVAKNFNQNMPNPRYDKWWIENAIKLKDKIPQDDYKLLMKEIDFLNKNKNNNLPEGIIHGDLFKDNVLMKNNKVSGIIDFYYACNGQFIYDIAISINDWANNKNQIDNNLKKAYLKGYNSERSLSKEEINYLPIALRSASIRFWVSRLIDYYTPSKGKIIYKKDPDDFKKLLLFHQNY